MLRLRATVSAVKRTVGLATLPINRAKYAELRSVIESYAGIKRRFVNRLRSPAVFYLLDRKQSFRDHAKRQGWYPDAINVHLVDQAAFDAVETCVRHIESRIATSDLKARIRKRFTDEDARHTPTPAWPGTRLSERSWAPACQ